MTCARSASEPSMHCAHNGVTNCPTPVHSTKGSRGEIVVCRSSRPRKGYSARPPRSAPRHLPCRRLRSRLTATPRRTTGSSTTIGPVRSTKLTIAPCAPRSTCASHWCTSSELDPARTDRSTPSTFSKTIRQTAESCFRQAGVRRWARHISSKTPSSVATLLSRFGHVSISRASEPVCFPRRHQCAICRLKEIRLLDAAHIVGDAHDRGEPAVNNGLSLCSIHHRAYDQDLVGVTPQYEVQVSERLLDEDDGPMLQLLKEAHGGTIVLPRRVDLRPDRAMLAMRFVRFAGNR